MHHILVAQAHVTALFVFLEGGIGPLLVGQHAHGIHKIRVIDATGLLLHIAQATDARRIGFLAHDRQPCPDDFRAPRRGYSQQAFRPATIDGPP